MELARRSGVNVRNIRHYEQDAPSIAKAESATLSALARILGCNLSDLLIPQTEITDGTPSDLIVVDRVKVSKGGPRSVAADTEVGPPHRYRHKTVRHNNQGTVGRKLFCARTHPCRYVLVGHEHYGCGHSSQPTNPGEKGRIGQPAGWGVSCGQ